MEIRKSLGRFLSIFFIVALGVSLFAGIRATQPDMILSGDAYMDENKLMDIKVMSTYGLTQEDVDVIGRLPAIDRAIGSYSTDVLCKAEENLKVLHVMAQTEDMNLIHVSEGRLPENDKECLVDEDFLKSTEYKVGDVIELQSGTNAALTDTLQTTSYKIVGAGSSSLYFALDRGSSTIGNGSVSGFLIVQPEAFALDVYTEIFATVDGAEDTLSFSEEYDTLVEEAIEQIELIQNVRCEVRRNDLAETAQLEIDAARNELNEKKEEAESQIEENEEKLSAAELEIQLGKLQIENGKVQLESAKAQLLSGKEELESSKALYEKIMTPLQEKKQELEDEIIKIEEQIPSLGEEAQKVAQEAIKLLREQITEVETQIESVIEEFEAEIAAGEAQIAEAEAEIANQEKELLKAEKELQAGSSEIASGKETLGNAKEEMDQQIQEGKEKIEEAEKEIAGMELPVWYVFDRSSIPEYSGYGDNADRIAALATVFPSIFFLVAALISLTTMTRMVEEQRTQIGTLKALGYSKFAIMKKYVNYALAATIGGSLLGVLVGEKLFPYIIIVSYKIMYVHIPHVLVPYHWGYGLAATGVAMLCTVLATLFSCYKELISQPAILMRPQAPQIGKRTLIEKIPFLWKHLNFTWKSSLRNLFRYKKRFFMTLFGIGGCMGLLLVGYGLRDSISSVATKQYGELQLYKASVFLSEDMTEEEREALEGYLSEEKKIENYKSVHMSSITTQKGEEKVDAYLTVIRDPKQLEEFFVYRSRTTGQSYELTDEGIIISEKTAKMLNVKAGDTMILLEDGMNEKKVKISAICENYMGHYVYMTETLYKKLYEKTPFYNNLLLKTDAEDTDLEKIGENILKYENILNIQYTKNISEQLNDMLTTLDSIMIVLITVAGMLSFVVLYNLNNININERRRELATLKVLGFYDLEVAEYVYRENILLTLIGTLVGCGIGKFLHMFTITTVEVDAAMFGREISMQSYLTGALFTIGFSIFVNFIMYFKLKKINMVESLKSVE